MISWPGAAPHETRHAAQLAGIICHGQPASAKVAPDGHTVFIEVLVLLHESDSITMDFIGSVQQISDLQAVRGHSQNQGCPVPDAIGLPG
jgi:hypothetical protein